MLAEISRRLARVPLELHTSSVAGQAPTPLPAVEDVALGKPGIKSSALLTSSALARSMPVIFMPSTPCCFSDCTRARVQNINAALAYAAELAHEERLVPIRAI